MASTTAPAPVATPAAPAKRSLASMAMTAATIGAVVLWALFLRPPFLGGPAGYVVVSGISMQPALHSGDFVVTRKQATYAKGDTVAFRVPQGDPGAGGTVIHRIVGGSATAGYRTQGDNRDEPDMWRPKPVDVIGEQWLHIPKLGVIMHMASQPMPLAIIAGLLAFLHMMTSSPKKPSPNRKLR